MTMNARRTIFGAAPRSRVAFFVIGSLYARPCARKICIYAKNMYAYTLFSRHDARSSRTNTSRIIECGTIANARTRMSLPRLHRNPKPSTLEETIFFHQVDAAWLALINKRLCLCRFSDLHFISWNVNANLARHSQNTRAKNNFIWYCKFSGSITIYRISSFDVLHLMLHAWCTQNATVTTR